MKLIVIKWSQNPVSPHKSSPVRSASKEIPTYNYLYSERPRQLQSPLLHPLHQKVVQGISWIIQKHNSCPLCREEYRTITYKNQTIPVEVPERAQRRPVVQRTLTPPQRRILFLPVHTLPSFPQVYPFTMFPAPHLQFFMMNSLLFPPLPTFYPQVPVTSLNLSLSWSSLLLCLTHINPYIFIEFYRGFDSFYYAGW